MLQERHRHPIRHGIEHGDGKEGAFVAAPTRNERLENRFVGIHARGNIADGYADALPSSSPWRDDRRAFQTALAACRAQVAVQWIGRHPAWLPPPDHRQDWAAVLSNALDRLEL